MVIFAPLGVCPYSYLPHILENVWRKKLWLPPKVGICRFQVFLWSCLLYMAKLLYQLYIIMIIWQIFIWHEQLFIKNNFLNKNGLYWMVWCDNIWNWFACIKEWVWLSGCGYNGRTNLIWLPTHVRSCSASFRKHYSVLEVAINSYVAIDYSSDSSSKWPLFLTESTPTT